MPEHGRDGQLIQAKYSDELKRRLLAFLERRHFRHPAGPKREIAAWPLAKALRLRPDQARESRRRRVRELVKEARNEGAPIASDGTGYHLATEVEDFAKTEQFLRRMGLGRLATAAGIRRSVARQSASGQLMLSARLAHAGLSGALNFYRGGLFAAPEVTPEPPAESRDPEPPQGWLFA